jgi:hypothetical protein
MHVSGDSQIMTTNKLLSRSQWPRGLGRRSTAARLLRSWVRKKNPTGGIDIFSVVCVVRFQVEVSATS